MRFVLLPTILLGALAIALPAFAQDDSARKEAEARFQEGLALHDAGNDEQARLKFTQAYSMFPSPVILFSVARSEQLSGKHVDAATHYRRFLREPEHPKVTADMRARARTYLGELTRNIAQVKIEARKDAKITIDGKPTDDSFDEPVAVTPGKHVLEARSDGNVERVEIEAALGATVPARFRTGATTLPPSGLEPTPTTPPSTGSSWSTGKTVTVLGLSVVAVGSLVTGAGFFVGAGQRSDDITRLQQTNPNCTNVASSGCSSLSDAVDAHSRDQTLGGVFLGVGIAAGIGAASAAIFWPSSEKSSKQLGIQPFFTHRSVGLAGHF